MKEQIKAPEEIQLSDEEIANLSDADCWVQNTGNQDAHRIGCHKMEEEVKAMLSKIKKNVQGTTSDRKETGTQINGLEQKKK